MNLTIEEMREIVDGAPELAHYWRDMDSVCSPNEISYYAWFGGALLVFEDGEGWIKSIYHDGYEYILDQLQELKDLRAAIADHDRTDHVTDIRNHVAPTTIVLEVHVNEALRLNRLG